MLQKFLLLLITFYIAGCTSNPPAPVIDRAPSHPKPATPATQSNNTDWRPNTYTVKKGDTLYAIGLEFGHDYKEIASANNISPPYQINIGQKLILPNNNNGTTPPAKTPSTEAENGVVVTPISDTLSDIQATTFSAVTPVLSHPKTSREPYSAEAYARTSPTTKPVEVVATKPSAKPVVPEISSTKPAEIKPADDEAINWAWPTEGKIVSNFNEGSNKGLDIAGKLGQSVNAASSGKVIYSGSDLRGYGKLVIIKHNKTYLSVYAHNNKLLVKEGQIVTSGQKIAEMGSTDTTMVKLHFEIRRQGKSVDPAGYLNQNQ